jgi:hypothetical protein
LPAGRRFGANLPTWLLLDKMAQSPPDHVVIVSQKDADHGRFSQLVRGRELARRPSAMNKPSARQTTDRGPVGSPPARHYVDSARVPIGYSMSQGRKIMLARRKRFYLVSIPIPRFSGLYPPMRTKR